MSSTSSSNTSSNTSRGTTSSMTTVCLAGATGWAGSALARGIAREHDLELISGITRRGAGRRLSELLGGADGEADDAGGLDVPLYATAAEALAATPRPPDVFVEYSHPSVAKGNIGRALAAGAHVVVGTSGLSDEELEGLGDEAEGRGLGLLACGNFAITMVLLQRFAEMAARLIPNWELFDYAAGSKPDAPSGTVRELAARLGRVGEPTPEVPVAETVGPKEARGATLHGTQVHSVRLPGFVIGAEAVFGLEGQRLSIRADGGSSAEPYVGGALLAIRKVGGLVGLHRGLDSVLELT